MMNLAWIHITEQKAGRRLTDGEVDTLDTLLSTNGWANLFEYRIQEDEDVKKALDNFVKGIS